MLFRSIGAKRPQAPPADVDTPFSTERDSKTGYWAIRDKDGSLLTLCVDRTGAEQVVKRFRAKDHAWNRKKKRATLFQTKHGWCIQFLIGYCPQTGNPYTLKCIYATREEAERHLN